ncbi:hypothetical protein BB560_000934, partial [Smittium megazygosporum]
NPRSSAGGSKTSKKKTKYTKKELNQLKEYGQLDPTAGFGLENDLEEAISRAINAREVNRFAVFPAEKPVYKETKSNKKQPKYQDSQTFDTSPENESGGIGSEIDPYISHFESISQDQLVQRISKVLSKSYSKTTLSTQVEDSTITLFSTLDSEPLDFERKISNQVGIEKEQVKHRIINNFISYNKSIIPNNNQNYMTEFQQKMFTLFNSYKDILFSGRTYLNSKELISVYSLHALNHILKTRDRIVKHNVTLSKNDASEKNLEIRDQGFTRPTVLVVLPYRNQAHQFIKNLIKLVHPVKIINQDRFESEFGDPDFDEENTKADPKKSKKPDEHKAIFSGNIDDSFRIGIRITRKAMKLYSDFYLSDILIVSPIGLRMITGSENIEVLILDQCDAFLMQNWDHVQHLFSRLNLIPKKPRDADFSRIRTSYLDGLMKHLRQTIMLSDFITPEFLNLFNANFLSYGGKLMLKPEYKGTMSQILLSDIELVFNRVSSKSVSESLDARFKYFVEKILPYIEGEGNMIFIPSYFDYVRIRNHIKRETSLEAGYLCEYTSRSDISRNRTWFFHGRFKVILYTERLHYYYRYKLRGTKRIIFYGLPDHPQYFPELVNEIEVENENISKKGKDSNKNKPLMEIEADTAAYGSSSNTLPQCLGLFTKYDLLKLERIVGSKEASKMVNSGIGSFTFYS